MDEFRMTPFLEECYEEERNGGLLQVNSKFRFLKANRRFFLPPNEPKQNVIPNPFIH
jgi:hypothetical protein